MAKEIPQEIKDYLYKNKNNPQAVHSNNQTLLMLACQYKPEYIHEILINHQYDCLHAEDNEGNTAIFYAVLHNPNAIYRLLDYGDAHNDTEASYKIIEQCLEHKNKNNESVADYAKKYNLDAFKIIDYFKTKAQIMKKHYEKLQPQFEPAVKPA